MIEKKIMVGEGTEYPLNGILTLPDSASPEAPVPAVVFVHGSGSSNMDEKVMKLTPFKDLAEGLAAHEIASIRYDKRSFAYGRKMLKEGDVTVVSETIEDAVLAAGILREEPSVDSGKIFIIGHSMGAMLAPRIDAEGGDFAGLVLMAGTPRTLDEVMMGQNEDVLRKVKGLTRWIAKKQVVKLEKLFAPMYETSDEEAKTVKVGGGTTLYYFKELAAHPAADYLLADTKPVLIMQGDKDFQVSVEKDFNAYKTLLKDRPNVTYRLYEGLNHAFVPAISDNIMKVKQEYGTERHIGEEVIGDLASWIHEQTEEK
ncbi:MAG: alpha/beta fold hydrolase [Firmicutes bacterium]|nr:alpha/beta fold hydrolase [Bacillota bacterium]